MRIAGYERLPTSALVTTAARVNRSYASGATWSQGALRACSMNQASSRAVIREAIQGILVALMSSAMTSSLVPAMKS